MTPAIVLLGLVTTERIGELWLAKRNTSALFAKGAVEKFAGHYPLIVLLHATWLIVLWKLGWAQAIHLGWLTVFCVLQVLRLWVLATLGRRWTTRIIVTPGEIFVARGLYRFVSHPNYIVVIGEIAVLPLCLGLPWIAFVFSIANGLVLTIRIRAENTALEEVRHAATG
jgi:methyltransferase